ncbi:hypothetical protein HPB47_009082 [Ixodes persulcatus]|uniref:Uncharacterized protein n=1 Tax=Ixodes persulcatus TaxID=34615 RepID=A0AC60P2Y9_IXOPE|nr:hypothetical protein HPB47_009082 [Ixodes persulcatus]
MSCLVHRVQLRLLAGAADTRVLDFMPRMVARHWVWDKRGCCARTGLVRATECTAKYRDIDTVCGACEEEKETAEYSTVESFTLQLYPGRGARNRTEAYCGGGAVELSFRLRLKRSPAVPDYPDIIDLEGDDLYFDAVERLPPVQAAKDPQLADALENPPLLDILDNELHVDDQAEENGDQGTDGGQHNTPPANDADLLDDDQLPVILLPPDDVTPTDLPVDVPQQAEPEKRYILWPRETLSRPARYRD